MSRLRQTAIFGVVSVVFVTLSVESPLHADTIVGGFIHTNTTWTTAGNPYIAENSILIETGTTLTIEPDVEVRFAPLTGLVVASGELVARGTDSEPIRFTAN